MITDPFAREDSEFDEQDDKHTSLHQLVPWWQHCSLFDTKKTNREEIFTDKNGVQRTMQLVGLICDSRKTKAWNSGKPLTMRSYCMIRYQYLVW